MLRSSAHSGWPGAAAAAVAAVALGAVKEVKEALQQRHTHTAHLSPSPVISHLPGPTL